MSEPPYLTQELLNPETYPDTPSKIELVQTPTSYVFLAGNHAYKVKKAVDLGYLDYTTLDKRRFYCNREVQLNQRLCPDIYLDTVPITEEKDRLSVDGKGKTVEYAVKMLRLPREAMLNVLLAEDRVPAVKIADIARKMAEFHETAVTSDTISDYGDLEYIIGNTEENFIRSIKYLSKTISQKNYRDIKDYTNAFIENNTALFYERIADGRIKDCHGDVQAEHICINGDVYIYDCVEYNDSLRYCDVASEIALLAMDLDCYDRPDLSESLVDEYISVTGDEDLPQLLNFYKCYRAYDLGTFESMKLDNADISEEEAAEIAATAGKYFELAASYI